MSRPAPRPRSDFRHFVSLGTRWGDNDVYGHLNNVVHLGLFDTAVNRFLIEHAGFEPLTAAVIGIVAENGCSYFAPLAYPDVVEVGLVVAHVGTRAVRYELGLFAEGAARAAAQGHFVHVMVDRRTRRPEPIPAGLRAALERMTA